MILAGFRLLRRLICAAILLVMIACAAEVGVRAYEAVTNQSVCREQTQTCPIDPPGLTIPSRIFLRELKPQATATVENRDTRQTVEIQTNSFGLRGPEFSVPKPQGTYRIVVLGDETIFAPETEVSRHCLILLQEHLQRQTRLKIEVINAGLPGGCPLTEYLFLKQRLLAVQPDLVLLHFDWSDVADDQAARRRTCLDPEGTPVSCAHPSFAPTPRALNPLEKAREQFRIVDWGLFTASRQWKDSLAPQSANSREESQNPYAWMRDNRAGQKPFVMQSFRPIAEIARLAESAKFQFAVLTSPKPWQVSARCSRGRGVRLACKVADDAHFPNRAPFEALADFTIKQQVEFADASLLLSDGPTPEKNFLKYAPRWSASGHERMADFLASFLHERIAGPWSADSPNPSRDELPISRTQRSTGNERSPDSIRDREILRASGTR